MSIDDKQRRAYAHSYAFLYEPKLPNGEDAPCLGVVGKAENFWALVNMFWGKGSAKYFMRHPWAEKMVEELCKNRYLGLSGCESSGKTDMLAVWGIINWFVAPQDTMVLVTSTSLKESRKRIWGSIRE